MNKKQASAQTGAMPVGPIVRKKIADKGRLGQAKVTPVPSGVRERLEWDARDELISTIVVALGDYDKVVGHRNKGHQLHAPDPDCVRCSVLNALPDWVAETFRREVGG